MINAYSYHKNKRGIIKYAYELRFRRLNDFIIIVGREGFLLACYDVCISLCDIWGMCFVLSFSQNGAGVSCRVFLKKEVLYLI